MKEDRFDSNIKNKLLDHRADVSNADWLSMNDRLNSEFGFENTSQDDLEFDQQISTKLENSNVFTKPEHWNILLKRLEIEEQKLIRKFTIRILKFVAIFLLLLTIWNWNGNKQMTSSQESDVVVANSEIFVNQLESLKSSVVNVNNIDKEKVQSKGPSEISTVIDIPMTTTQGLGFLDSANDNKIKSTVVEAKNNENNIINKVVYDNIKNLSADRSMITYVENGDDEKPIDQKLNFLEDLDIILISERENVFEEKYPLIEMEQSNETNKYALSIIGSSDLFLIRSPDDPIYPLLSYYTGSRGFSGGVTFGAQKGNIEMETGILFSNVSYQPKEYKEQYESSGAFFETSLDNIYFNMISVPLNIKAHIKSGSKSNFYTVLGTSFNAIISSDFSVYDKPIATPPPSFNGETVNGPLLDQKEFNPGLFEGGSFFDNTFFTLDIGIGYQHQINKNFSFFVQPSIHTQFTQGLGPNEDRLHKLSLYLGTKYYLN